MKSANWTFPVVGRLDDELRVGLIEHPTYLLALSSNGSLGRIINTSGRSIVLHAFGIDKSREEARSRNRLIGMIDGDRRLRWKHLMPPELCRRGPKRIELLRTVVFCESLFDEGRSLRN